MALLGKLKREQLLRPGARTLEHCSVVHGPGTAWPSNEGVVTANSAAESSICTRGTHSIEA
jgi:hypothetical protein